MGIKVNSGNIARQIEKVAKQYDQPNAREVEVGVTDASIAEYAQYVEFGWVQSVTPKQSLYLSNAIGQPVPFENGQPVWKEAAIKPGSALVNQPRPFLRGTLAAEQGKWRETLRKALHKFQDSAIALAVLGTVAAQDVQETITRGGTSKERFPERSSLTMALYEAAATGGKKKGKKARKGQSAKSNTATTQPLIYSGALLHSIGFEVK